MSIQTSKQRNHYVAPINLNEAFIEAEVDDEVEVAPATHSPLQEVRSEIDAQYWQDVDYLNDYYNDTDYCDCAKCSAIDDKLFYN